MGPTTLAYLTVSASPILPIPLPAYMTCTFVGHLPVGTAFVVVSLAYGMEPLLSFFYEIPSRIIDHPPDLLAFSVIVYLVPRSNVTKIPIPSILKTIAWDSTHYFLVIFTSHLMMVVFFWFAGVSTSSYSSLFSLRIAYTFAESSLPRK